MNKRDLDELAISLKILRADQDAIASDWNGKDDVYRSFGVSYTEDDAHRGSQIVSLCDELVPLLEEML